MYSIFSDYEPIMGKNCEETKPSKIYDRLRNVYNQGGEGVLSNTRMFLGTADECDILYKIWENSDLQRVCKWAMKKIVLEIGKATYETIDVRLRIFSNMLDKVPISNLLRIQLQTTFVQNVRWEMSNINVEDLPF